MSENEFLPAPSTILNILIYLFYFCLKKKLVHLINIRGLQIVYIVRGCQKNVRITGCSHPEVEGFSVHPFALGALIKLNEVGPEKKSFVAVGHCVLDVAFGDAEN